MTGREGPGIQEVATPMGPALQIGAPKAGMLARELREALRRSTAPSPTLHALAVALADIEMRHRRQDGFSSPAPLPHPEAMSHQPRRMVGTNSLAEQWGVTDRTVRNWFEGGRIPGAQKVEGRWQAPDNTRRPR